MVTQASCLLVLRHVRLLILLSPVQTWPPPAVDAGPSSTLPRPRPAQAGPQPERCRSLGDLSHSPPFGRRAAVRAASSSADVSPLRRVLTRRMNSCAHHRPRPTCTVVVEQPVCSPAPLWCSASK